MKTMKKAPFIFTLLSLLLLSLSSCKKESVTVSVFTNYNLELLTQVLFADEVKGKETFAFTSTKPWTTAIDTANSWVTIDNTSGEAGSSKINITLEENMSGTDREAKIDIKADDSVLTITVSQKATTEAGVVHKPLITSVVAESFDDKGVAEADKSYIYFKYDTQNRLIQVRIEFTMLNGDNKPEVFRATRDFTYSESKIIEKANFNSDLSGNIFTLNDKGYIISVDRENPISLQYNAEGYLSKQLELDNTISFSWKDGNLVTLENPKASYSQLTEITYSGYENNTNLDLNTLLSSSELESGANEHFLIGVHKGVMGKSSKNLVSISAGKYKDDSDYITRFEYEVNEHKLPVKITTYTTKPPLNIEYLTSINTITYE